MRQKLLHDLLVCLLLFSLESGVSLAKTYADLHDFNCSSEGCQPYVPALLAQGRDGNLYGTASAGGINNQGTVFKITPAGTVTTLYKFDGTTGSFPYGGLSLGLDGNFYGTTNAGGTSGTGTIFKITPDGTLTVLHHFGSVKGDGGSPYAPPTQGADGSLYGVTSGGAAYKISSSGVFKLLNGSTFGTFAPLIQASDGKFYGTSAASNVVFKMTTSGKVSVLYTFDGKNGESPFGPVTQGADGSLYGTTYLGGTSSLGVVFRITLKGAIKVLLNADSNFGHPYAGLVAATDGKFYSGTRDGGGTFGQGMLFRITRAGASKVESSFDGTHGTAPYGTPMQHTNGSIYGLTYGGGANGGGVFYRLNAGLKPFVSLLSSSAKVGKSIDMLGQGFTGTTLVSFNGTAATFTVLSDTYLTATVPAGATTGTVTVTTPGGNLNGNKVFRVTPVIQHFSPASGPVGTPVQITGVSLTQATRVTFGGVQATTFSVNSDTQVMADVPTGAKTGVIAITTPGGTATSSGVFTVTQK